MCSPRINPSAVCSIPAMSIWIDAPIKGLTSVFLYFQYMLPADQAITAPSKHNPPSKTLKSNAMFKSLAKINTTPPVPSSDPAMINRLIFGFCGRKYSIPTTQNGRVLKISAVNPLGSHCSATTTNQFAIPRSSIPTIARCFKSFNAGNL